MESAWSRRHRDDSLRFDRRRYRTVWISDVHLGFRGCSAEYLLDFLRSIQCEYLYLVGDIIDIWSMMFVGRVSVEKNLDAFLGLDLPGTKIVVGDGPDLERLKARHPGALFLGEKRGRDLARHFAAADVFVFPSRTDTFGLVMLEAMACGAPVAAYPVTGPIDVVEHGRTGILDDDPASAVRRALELDPAECVASAHAQSWEHATRVFESLLSRWRGPTEEHVVQAEADSGSGP